MFELADDGTILLDEIGEMSLDLQSKLLRVLQEREILRVGGSRPKKVNLRVICSTNRDLQEMVYEGKFREDLYYRINTVEIPIPPLRERLDDLPVLCDFLVRKINGQYQINCLGPDAEVLNLFRRYPWPGNIRELEHTLERLAFLNQHGQITMRRCDFLVRRLDTELFSRIFCELKRKINTIYCVFTCYWLSALYSKSKAQRVGW